MEEHFFQMKRIYDENYLEFDDISEYKYYIPKRNIYFG